MVETLKKTYMILTYGCQMNEHDSEKIASQIEDLDYSLADSLADSDLIILNTCCVREKAEEKVQGKLGEIKLIKEKKPQLIVGIGGCMMQQEGYARKFKSQYPYVDFIFGTHTLDEVSHLVEKARQKERLIALKDDRLDIPSLASKRLSSFRAWVSIIKGCQNFCTYCIVPYVRGKEVSRPLKDIQEEVKVLAQDGVKEIVLLGQNVNAYGKDRGDTNFQELLCALNDIDGLKRIRYLTSHPRDFTLDLVDTILKLDKVCKHFHLPIQSGSNRILKAMGRGYQQEQYMEIIDHIKKKAPTSSITTDFIVGFPGETEDDFLETLKILRTIRFDSAFIFRYSKRKGTPAAKILDQVPEKTKIKNLQTLMKAQHEISLAKNKELLGQTLEVLSEGPSKKDSTRSMGRTCTNKPVIMPYKESGQLVNVKIVEANAYTLYAREDH